MPIQRQHNSRKMMMVLMSLLVGGAVFVFVTSLRSVYKTFSTPIRSFSSPTASVAQLNQEPAPGQSARNDAIVQGMLGLDKRMDANTLRTMLQLQGVDPKSLSTMTDEQLTKSYQEFIDRVSKTPPVNK